MLTALLEAAVRGGTVLAAVWVLLMALSGCATLRSRRIPGPWSWQRHL